MPPLPDPLITESSRGLEIPHTQGRPSSDYSRIGSSGTLFRSATNSSLNLGAQGGPYFRSRRIKRNPNEKIKHDWDEKKDPRDKWVTVIPIIGILLGCAVSGLLIWLGIQSVTKHHYCPVLIDDFSIWDDRVWTKEVEVGGFGYVVFTC